MSNKQEHSDKEHEYLQLWDQVMAKFAPCIQEIVESACTPSSTYSIDELAGVVGKNNEVIQLQLELDEQRHGYDEMLKNLASTDADSNANSNKETKTRADMLQRLGRIDDLTTGLLAHLGRNISKTPDLNVIMLDQTCRADSLQRPS